MPTVVTVGCQWGDEGKGKVISAVASQAEYVVRHQGGNNAGHTVLFGDEQFVTHLLPTGVLFPDVRNVIGSGVVIDPLVLGQELSELDGRGHCISPEKLLISGRSNLIMPYHKLLDGLEEERLGRNSVGTTKRGIGPAYSDKVARKGVKVFDLLDETRFRERTADVLELKNRIIVDVYGGEPLSVDAICDEYLPCAEWLRPHVGDDSLLVNQAIRDGKNVLFEAAQGTMLDIDFGTYPFLTSSNTIAGGACTGSGVSPSRIDFVLGIMKAYNTRVGAGPMPTELDGEMAEKVRTSGPIGEFGATTGRPRRCGWLDIPLGRLAVEINGIEGIALTRLDVLGHLDEIQVCTKYRLDGGESALPPADMARLGECEPVYETFASWKCDISEVRHYDDLPAEAQTYVEALESLLGVPMTLISVGPALEQTIYREQQLFRKRVL